jgi:sugar (pentulose or hexulose) kinase
MYWLGLDIGTGSSRALLIDERGAFVAGFTASAFPARCTAW